MANTLSLRASALLFAGISTVGVAIGACSGEDGAAGAAGTNGAAGVPGPAGPAGSQGPVGPAGGGDGGTGFGKACTTPCHTFNGVVDQWRLSGHSHPQENEVGGGACGNCHAIDGIANRVANQAVTVNDAGAQNVDKGHLSYMNGTAVGEVSYAGASTVGKIHCTTCHAFDSSNDPHVVGGYAPHQAPIRVPGGAADTSFIEASPTGSTTSVGTALTYATGNLCVFCHKSRKDVTLYITASNSLNQRWGPHNGPQADLFSGKGGYPLANAGESYGTATHTTIASACVSCHMQPVPGNDNTPDHTMKPQVTYCKTCHATFQGNNFDVNGGRALTTKGLSELQSELNTKGFIYRSATTGLTPDELADNQFQLDSPRTNAAVDAKTAGAVYNYLLLARGRDLGVHNPIYSRQLLWDSIRQIKGANPSFIPSRPSL